MIIKIGILGAGYMGHTHARAYKEIKDTEVVGIADINSDKAARLAKMYNAKSYSDPDKLIYREDVDVVDICLPTPLHHEYVMKAASNGKNILCEKPIALNLKQADAMINCAKNLKVKFMVAHTLRFWPEYVEAKQIVDKEILGKPLEISTTRLVGTPSWSENDWILNPEMSLGAALDLNIHDIDFATWILGKPKSIFSRGLKSFRGAYDHIISVLDYERGNQAFVEAGWMFPQTFPFTTAFRVLCRRGCIDFNFKVPGTAERREKAESSFVIYKGTAPPGYRKIVKKDPYGEEIRYFIECVKDDREPTVVTPEQAKLALRITLAGLKSIETGRVVKL